jgi:outer membrane lipase/esterase
MVFRVPAQALAGLAAAVAAGPATAQEAFGRVVVFGDSISDGGAYADRAPAGAGRFTTNPDPVWVEHVAAGLGLELKPRAAGGTNYAEGGARVTVPRPGAPGELSRTPVVNQIDAFLTNGASFRPDDLVILQGGGNDVFATQTNGLSFTPADLVVLDRAAADLAAQTKRMAAAGGPTIVTASVPRFEVFNSRYRAELANAGVNLLYVDVAGLVAEAEAFPAEFGLVNTTDRACRGRLVESFTCLPTDYVTPDANRTYLFADGVHFTGVVHEMEADLTLAALRAPAQVGQLALAGQLALQSATAGARPSEGLEPGHWSIFGRADWAGLDQDAGPWAGGLDGHVDGATAGLAYGLRPGLTVGAALGWRDGDAAFGGDLGGFDPQAATVSVFAHGEAGPFHLTFDATYGDLRFKDVTRQVKLGPATRLEAGDTHGRAWSAGAEFGVTEAVGPLVIRPLMGVRYERVEVGAYAEAGERSSQITFGDQEAEQLLVSVGTEVAWQAGGRVQPFVRATYEADVLDETRWLSITPHGAPVPFRSRVAGLDGEYVAYAAGARIELQPRWRLAAEVAGTAGRGESDAPTVRVGVQARF